LTHWRHTVLELCDLLLQNLRATLMAAVIVLALFSAVRLDALATYGFGRVTFLEIVEERRDGSIMVVGSREWKIGIRQL